MRRWLWVLCLAACSRRIDHYHAVVDAPDGDAAVPDATIADAKLIDAPDTTPLICPSPTIIPAQICSNPGFAAQTNLVAMGVTYPAAIGDLDGDGLNDIIRQTQTGFIAHVQRNGMLVTDGHEYPATGTFAIGDVSADGMPDVLIATATALSVFRGVPGATFVAGSTVPIGGIVNEIHVADLGGNNCAPELVVVHQTAPQGSGGPQSESFTVLRNRGAGSFDPEVAYPLAGLSSVVLGDFDEDGKPDVVAAGTNNIAFFHGNADTTFAPPVLRGGPTYPLQIAAAYNNSVGHLDLILSIADGGGTYSLGTMHGHGNGTFDAVVTQPSMEQQGGHLMRTMDFNGDGWIDVVLSKDGTLGVHLGRSDGTFDAVKTYAMPGWPWLVGDLDNDKRADTIVVTGAATQTLYEVRGTCL